jgi:hypothetical protein
MFIKCADTVYSKSLTTTTKVDVTELQMGKFHILYSWNIIYLNG